MPSLEDVRRNLTKADEYQKLAWAAEAMANDLRSTYTSDKAGRQGKRLGWLARRRDTRTSQPEFVEFTKHEKEALYDALTLIKAEYDKKRIEHEKRVVPDVPR